MTVPPKLRHGAALLLAVLLLAGAGVGANRVHWQLDLTAGRSLTLADQTRSVVARVSRANIRAYLARADPDRAPAAALLSRYHRLNPRISFQIIDPAEAPGQARKDDVDPTMGGLVMSGSGRTERAPSASEQDITAALARLERGGSPVVCLSTGHGEPAPEDTSPTGLATLAGLLVVNGFRVETADLLVDAAVPTRCDALVIANPTSALGPAEAGVARYLAGGGHALVLNDPASTVDLSPILRPYGITVVHGLVLEGDDNSHLPNDPLSVIVRNFASSSAVIRNLPPVVFPTAEAILADPKPAEGLNATTIATSTALSFLSRHPADTATRFDPSGDLRGPVPMGAVADQVSRIGGRVQHIRVVALGDVDFALNGLIGEAGNSQLVLQSLDWLTLADDLVSVNAHVPAYRPLVLTTSRLRYLRGVTAGAIPALYLLGGAMVWAWRRPR